MNELIKLNGNLIAEIDKKSLGEIIKPLKKEIPLLDYYVNDINELCSDVIFVKIKEKDTLCLKADNMAYRSTSVGVYFEEQRIGELYEGEEKIPYNLLTAVKELKVIAKNKYILWVKKFCNFRLKCWIFKLNYSDFYANSPQRKNTQPVGWVFCF